MTHQQFRKALLQLGLHSYERAASVLGISRSSVIRYMQEKYPVPPYLERLVEMFCKHGIPQEFR